MPGIIVGIDGSDHSRRALEWAVNEAAVRHAPLTVLTINQAVVGYGGGPVEYPGDADRAEQARKAAQALTDSILEKANADSPSSVTVEAVTGFPAEEILRAGARGMDYEDRGRSAPQGECGPEVWRTHEQ